MKSNSNAPIKLLGGVSYSEALAIFNKSSGINHSHKNLFIINVKSNLLPDFNSFNMFVKGVDYEPFTITGDTTKIGGANVSLVTSSEPITLNFTALDDDKGTIKKWFSAQCDAVVAGDGTIGLPVDYAIEFEIITGTIIDNKDAFKVKALYRAASLNTSLMRGEQALEELTMTFNQLDTFI